jgi:hypothetical protein
MRVAHLLAWAIAAWGVLLTLGLLTDRLPSALLPARDPVEQAHVPSPAPCACEPTTAAVAPPATPAEPPHEQVIDAPRHGVCGREEGPPVLSALRLSQRAPELWALHCGSSVHLLAIEREGEQLSPRRVALLRAPSYSQAESARAVRVSAGDIDGDGRPDLIVPELLVDRAGAPVGGALYLLRQRAEGGFGAATRALDLAPGAATAARLDEQAGADLALLQLHDPRGARAAELWLVHGGPSPLRFAQLPAGVGASALAVADLDRDGIDDVAVVDERAGRVRLWLSGHGTAPSGEPVVLELPGVREAIAGDLDGDGHADVLVGGEQVWSLLAREGFVAEPQAAKAIADSAGLRDVQLIDVDADGKLDVVGYAHPQVIALVQSSALHFERRTLATLQGETSVLTARVAKLDEDGKPDLVILAISEGPAAEIELALARNVGASVPVRLSAHSTPVRDAPLLEQFALP